MLDAALLGSAAVPALLLARSVTGRWWAASLAAAAGVAVPWLQLEPLSRNEALGYAAFVWALLALYRAVARPSSVNDAVALGAIAGASVAHRQLLVLIAALPAAIVLHERTPVLASRRLLVAVYASLLLVVGLLAAGVLDGGETWRLVRDSFPPGLRRAFVEHVAALALSVAIAPLVIGLAWTLGTLARPADGARHAFAAVALATAPLLGLSAAVMDLRYAGGEPRERYLVYAAAVVLVAAACALVPIRMPRWTLITTMLTWFGLGLGLSRITGRVNDWFVMTDELLYERLAISIARGDSPLPRVRGELIESYNQLYPQLISRVYEIGFIPDSLHDAHVLNAFVMTSALVPAYLLARSVTGRNGLAFGVGLLTVAVPWLTLSSFLLTEAVAYPAFLWAMLAAYRATAEARPVNDVLALVAIAVAVLARVQLLVLLVVFPLTLLLHDRTRAFRRHPVAFGAYAALAVGAAVLSATVGLSRALGTYAITVEEVSLRELPRAVVEHVAPLALALAVLPFLVAAGWLLRTIVRPREARIHAFASLALVAVSVVTVQVAYFDQRFGEQFPYDRYLFYVVPPLLLAFGCALVDPPWPGWSLLGPTALVAAAFAFSKWPRFEKLNFQAPLATLNDPIVELGGSVEGARAFGVLATLVLLLLFVEGARRVVRPVAAAVLAAVVALAVPAETGYAFWRLFAVPGTSGRALTHDQAGVFNWVDRAVGPDDEVTMVPYPHLQGDYWSAVAFWWDLEFWNRSVVRAAGLHGEFQETPPTFRTIPLRWDPRGVLNVSPTRYAAQLIRDSRFRIAGEVVWNERETDLIDAGDRWRLAWATSGLYEDGWTRPDNEARVTVFPEPGQQRAEARLLTLHLDPPGTGRDWLAHVGSNLGQASTVVRDGTASVSLPVCVRPGEGGDVRLTVPGAAPIYGNPVNAQVFAQPRMAALNVRQIELAEERSPGCWCPFSECCRASGSRAPSDARTQGALIAEAMGATEDAAARRVIAGQKPEGIC